MSGIIEVTKELFDTLITNTELKEIEVSELYQDTIFYKFGSRIFYRSQNGYTNYYIEDFNK